MWFKLVLCFFTFISIPWNTHAQQVDNQHCGIVNGQPLTNHYGPWDFTNPAHSSKFPIVLNVHFTPKVERLIAGATATTPNHDLDYTLRAIPNYHRALFAIMTLELRGREAAKKNNDIYIPPHYTAECYLKRAIYWQPGDAISHMLYGIYFHKTQEYDKAEQQYLRAVALQPNNPELSYNLGLLYVEKNDLNNAKKYAAISYAAGYPLPGLQQKINSMENKTQK